MTFQKLHCVLTAAACAGIVICAALSHARELKRQPYTVAELDYFGIDAQRRPAAQKQFEKGEWKMQPFTMTPFEIKADLGLDDLSLDGKGSVAVKKTPSAKNKAAGRAKAAVFGVKK
jgi:hypothetical protein